MQSRPAEEYLSLRHFTSVQIHIKSTERGRRDKGEEDEGEEEEGEDRRQGRR